MLPIPEATAPVVARMLDEQVFCYMGLPKRMHTDQGNQFESALMAKLCRMRKVDESWTTPYHP